MFNKIRTAPVSAIVRNESDAVQPRLVWHATVVVAAALVLFALGACSPRMERGADGAPHAPMTGSARGEVVPNALPGAQPTPDAASTAGSSLSQSSGAVVPRTGSAQGVRVPAAR